MNFLKRGLFSVIRRKGKTTILFVIIFILGNIMAGSVAVQQATVNVEKNIKQRMGGTATISVDYDKLYAELDSEMGMIEMPDQLPTELIEEISNSPAVRYYDYNMHYRMYSKDLEPFIPEGMSADDAAMMGERSDDNGVGFSLIGVQYPKIATIIEKNWAIEGRTFTDEEINKGAAVAVISKKVAEENNLHLGDSIVFVDYIFDYTQRKSNQMPVLSQQDIILEIIGLYDGETMRSESALDKQKGMAPSEWQAYDEQNTLFVPNALVKVSVDNERLIRQEQYKDDEEQAKFWSQEYVIQPIYYLADVDDAESFREEVLAKLPENYRVILSSDGFENVAGSIYTMRKLANMVLYVAMGATVLILTLLIILFLRDRKHELGIYLALGEKRTKVIAQVFIEVLLVAFVAISASLITGNIIASSVSDNMLIAQMEADANVDKNMMIMDAPTNEEILENYEVKLNLAYVGLIYAVGLGTVIIAVVGPMIYILRLNPKKIMM